MNAICEGDGDGAELCRGKLGNEVGGEERIRKRQYETHVKEHFEKKER